MVKWIKGQRIRWLGHLERMEEDRMPRKIFTQELEGTRRRGRPRKGWKEEAEKDLQVLGVRRWRELVTDRKKMEGHFSTGQSQQWEEEEEEEEKEEEEEEEEEEEVNITHNTPSNGRSLVNNELKVIWKLAVLSYFGVPPRHMSGRGVGV